MPAPSSATYSAAAKVAAHTALLNLISTGGPAVIKIRSAADALLGTITLTSPAGTVNSGTGQITLTAAAVATGAANGNAAYGEICESGGTVHLALPAAAGSAPVSGSLVLSSLTIVSGGAIVLVSATIG